MDANEYKKVKEIFNSVLEIQPEGRDAFLDEKCAGDQSLRDEVDRLLRSYDSEYLERPAVGDVADRISVDSLCEGETIGHYKVVKKIGAGGMGEVYLAEDEKLGRRVAIKLLPEMFTGDPDRLNRFQREARSASSLNHPNILTIHEIGEADGTHYIATEYIDGETLRAKMNHGRLQVSESLDIAVQCASALAAAHEAGIIHRDIKPENIMLRPDGLVKVLDFGLAKLIEKQNVAVSHDALTERHLKTAPGMIMGTVQYMSPEQTRGHETDARTDIWSLGCVIYEMAAGQQAFKGENTADLIAEIVKTHPAQVSATADDIPERLDEIIGKTLEKGPDERYQTAKDLLIDLNRLKKKLDFEQEIERSPAAISSDRIRTAKRSNENIADPTGENVPAITERRTTSSAEYLISGIQKNRLVSASVGLVVLLALLGSAYQFYVPAEAVPELQPLPFENFQVTRLTRTGSVRRPALSRDGKFVAFTETEGDMEKVVVQQVATGSQITAVPPTKVDLLYVTNFSNDGNFLYYISYEKSVGTLYRVPSVGGMPKKVTVDVDYSPAFSPDDSRFAFVRYDPVAAEARLMIANSDGSDERLLMDTQSIGDVAYVAWSPIGDRIFMVGMEKSSTQTSVGRLYTASVADKTIEPLGDKSWYESYSYQWLADGSGVLLNGRNDPSAPKQLWLISYPSGVIRQITKDANNYGYISEVSPSNTMAVARGEHLSSIWTFDMDSREAVQHTSENTNLLGANGVCELPDGRLLLTKKLNRPQNDFWITDLDGKNETRLSDDEDSFHTSPNVTTDGKYIVFNADRNGSSRIWRMDINGKIEFN